MSVKKPKDWLRPLAVGLAVGLLCSLAMASGILDPWSRRISDRLYSPRQADNQIVIVTIDDASMARLGRWPWARSVHAQLIDAISRANPWVIGYDVSFPEASDPKSDNDLARALKDSGKVVLPVEVIPEKTGSGAYFGKSTLLVPISEIAAAAARMGRVNLKPDGDGVVRRVSLSVTLDDGSRLPSFGAQIADLGGVVFDLAEWAGQDGSVLISFPNAPRKAFRMISAADIIDGKVGQDQLAGKFVLVGSTAPNLHDDYLVPTSISDSMPGVEIHASILDTLLQKKHLREVPGVAAALWLLLMGAIVGLIVPRLKARWSMPILFVSWAFTLVLAIKLFETGWLADVLWPSIVLVLGFAAVALERRIMAEKQKKEIRSAFSRYVSKSVVESILANPSKLHLGGERRRMTVLFSDVRGFTTISEGLTPERLVEIMNKYLSRMTDIVFERQGVLDKYIGDAVMAFWNAPFDQPDHAKQAVDTALDMLAALKEMNKAKAFMGKDGQPLELKIGVGVNTGEMVVGNMGAESRFDYTVIGDSVNLGSRLESLTKEYGVSLLITDATRRELNNGYLLRPIDRVAVKGKKEPVEVFEVMKRAKNATQEEKKFVARYEEAMAAYRKMDFRGAVSIADELLAERPDDGPSKTLKTRAEHCLSDPPPDDWDGVCVMTKK